MSVPIRIPAKTLGSMALRDFCPRCFWIGMHVQDKLPYQIFPGIFSSIDSYGKRLVEGWFDRHGSPPSWLSSLGDIKAYRPPPHFSKFNVFDQDSSVRLTGAPDGILVRGDNSHVIVDYKTAKYTETQDELFPMYEVQLNAYAYIGNTCGLRPVTGLALVYTEPVTDSSSCCDDANMTKDGFNLRFSISVLPVALKPEAIPRMMRNAREILDLNGPPNGLKGCENCARLRQLITIASR